MMRAPGSPPIAVARFFPWGFRTARCTTWPLTRACRTGSTPTVRTTARCAGRATGLRHRQQRAGVRYSRTWAAAAAVVVAVRRLTPPAGVVVVERSSLQTARLDVAAVPA